jgi:cytidylate kinase
VEGVEGLLYNTKEAQAKMCERNPMTVITISRQLGSLGSTLGRQVATRLGYRLVHREIINQAAQLAHSPDMALATIDELGLLGIEPEKTQQDAYLKAVETVLEKLVIEGNVIIVGRAGQAILRNQSNTIHLRVIAPLETRIRRIVKAHNVSLQAARAQIVDSDHYRADYLQRFYGTDWDDPTLYHLVINTGQMDLTTSAEVVCTAVYKISNTPTSQETAIE